MVTIIISRITENDIKTIRKALKGKGKIRYSSEYHSNVREKRLELIMNTYETCKKTEDKVSQEALFRKSRRFGYSMNRRTFHRDISILEGTGRIRKEIYNGGKFGRTTLIAKAEL